MVESRKQTIDIPAPGIQGWNNFVDADSLGDQETPDIQNMVYDGGFMSPRRGSALFAAKPSGESADPLQLIKTQTSDGVEYLIGIYGGSYWLHHPTTEAWIKINGAYTPTYTTLLYGYETWNNGRGDDRLYICNGRDSVVRWDICVTTASGAQSSGASSLTVADGSRFPNTGTLVIRGASTTYTEAYTSRSGNVFTLTNTLNENVADGAEVTLAVTEKASMQKGKVLRKHQSRLFIMNRYGAETAGYYSKVNDPEDFTTSSAVNTASSFVIADGNGEIIAAHDFGENLLIEKEDSHHLFSIATSSDLSAKLDRIKPIISGQSVGPRLQHAVVKMQSQLFYPTRTEGFIALSPTSTGDSNSTGLEVISQKIQTYVEDFISYTNCRGAAYRNKALWAVALSGATENTFVLMYDTLRKTWTKLANWGVVDFVNYNDNLYFLESGTGDVYQAFTNSYNDDNNPYESYFYTKRFNFGSMQQPKTNTLIYVQGYMTPASEIYADVLFNEGGLLKTQTFLIQREAEGLSFSQPLSNSLGEPTFGTISFGYVDLMEIGDVSVFRTYLGISAGSGFYNLQIKFYSNKEAFYGITGVGFNPELAVAVPSNMVLSPVNL